MSFENSQGNTEMEKPKIESEPFLMGKAIMPSIYPFSSPAFREDTLEKVLVPGQTYEFELVRIRDQNYVQAFKVFKAENTILAGAQGFALLSDFTDSLARNAGIVSFSSDPIRWLYQSQSEGVPYLYVRNNGTIEPELRSAHEGVGHTYVLRIKQA